MRTESFSRTQGQEPVSLHCPLGGMFTGFILHCAQKHCKENQVQAGPLPIKNTFLETVADYLQKFNLPLSKTLTEKASCDLGERARK